MNRYIYVDTHTDLVIGDTAEFLSETDRSLTPAEAATELDSHLGKDPPRRFALLPDPSAEDVYIVWQADAALPVSQSGDDTRAIEENEHLCEMVGFLTLAQ